MKNIYLIGMPGSGKTTVAKFIAAKLDLTLADMDKIIVEKTGASINDIFKEKGENYFRDVESDVLKELDCQDNTVVSTGGGVIKRPENIEILRRGTVVFIDVPVNVIAGRGEFKDRPLLRDNIENLNNLYNERYEIYKSSANILVSGEGEPFEVAQRIMSFLSEKDR